MVYATPEYREKLVEEAKDAITVLKEAEELLRSLGYDAYATARSREYALAARNLVAKAQEEAATALGLLITR